jgi:hypothetical protein
MGQLSGKARTTPKRGDQIRKKETHWSAAKPAFGERVVTETNDDGTVAIYLVYPAANLIGGYP